MGRRIKKGSTDQSTVIRIVDSTAFTPETGVEHNTSGIDLWYRREGATKTSITESALASLDAAHSDGGIEHIGDGYYRLDLPDAACATGANSVQIGGTVTGMIVIGNEHELCDIDPYDGVRMGMTALPNAAADAAGGLPISDAGGLDLDAKIGALTFTVAGDVDVNVQSWKGAAAQDMTGDAYARLGAPSGASVSADVAAVKSDTAAILVDTGTEGVKLADDAITAAKFDESTAFPLKSADTGATAVARTGADSDTLETLSDQLDGISASAISDAVWDEAIAGHADVGSTGAALSAAGGSGDPWATALPGAYGAGTAGKIIGDNINAPIGTVDTVVDAIKAVTDNLPNSGALSDIATAITTIDGIVDNILVDTGTTLEGHLTDIKGATFNGATDSLESVRDRGDAAWATATGFSTHSAADVKSAIEAGGSHLALIKAKTDNLPADPADDSDIDTQLAAIAAYIDTEVATLVSELAKVPKSDSNVAFNATALASIKNALEASGSDLDYLMKALVNKRIWTESGAGAGTLEMFSDAGSSLGTIANQVTSDGTYTTALRAVI